MGSCLQHMHTASNMCAARISPHILPHTCGICSASAHCLLASACGCCPSMLLVAPRVLGRAAASNSSSARRACSTRWRCMDTAVSTSTMAGSRARSSMRAVGGRGRPRPAAVGDRGGVSARLLSSLALALLLRLMPVPAVLLLHSLEAGLQRPRRTRATTLAALMAVPAAAAAASAAAAGCASPNVDLDGYADHQRLIAGSSLRACCAGRRGSEAAWEGAGSGRGSQSAHQACLDRRAVEMQQREDQFGSAIGLPFD